MTTMRYLLLGVTLACFVGGGLSVTDQEFQDLLISVSGMKKEIKDLSSVVERQEEVNGQQTTLITGQATVISQQAATIKRLTNKVEQLSQMMMDPKPDLVQNSTIEERVTTLEVQMMDVQEDVTFIFQDVSLLFENDNFLFDEQVIQDERLLNLEERMLNVDEDIEGLQDTTLELDFRVTVLEENGGSDGNSSISELEVRVETLEGTAADHETRLTAAESELEDLEEISADHETRLTSAEENIQGLQMTDIDHESRITALEENGGGGGNSQNETIAFHAVLTDYDTILYNSAVEFNKILLNEGNGYDNSTGVFTVPPGGDGVYYFSTYLLVEHGEYGRFEMVLNFIREICTATGEHESSGSGDPPQATCSGVVRVVEGDKVKLVLRGYEDDTPLVAAPSSYFSGFSGFRI